MVWLERLEPLVQANTFLQAGLQESGLVYFAQIDAASSAQLEIMLPVKILMGISQVKIPMSLCILVKKLFEKFCNLPFLCLMAWVFIRLLPLADTILVLQGGMT